MGGHFSLWKLTLFYYSDEFTLSMRNEIQQTGLIHLHIPSNDYSQISIIPDHTTSLKICVYLTQSKIDYMRTLLPVLKNTFQFGHMILEQSQFRVPIQVHM